MKEREYIFKVALVGDAGVGKRTLAKLVTVDILSDKFLEDYGVVLTYYFVRASGDTDVINAHFSIWDITGQPDIQGLRGKFEFGTRGLIVVANASRISTVENIDFWIANIKDSPYEMEIVLVLNKIDLVSKKELKRMENKMKEYAGKYNAELFLTSCEDKINVEEPFLEISKKLCSNVIGEIGEISAVKPEYELNKSKKHFTLSGRFLRKR